MDADSFHRLAKILVDSGEAGTLEEALLAFTHYGVKIVLNRHAMCDGEAQIIALTAINIAVRSFQGNVQVIGPRDMPLRAPGYEGSTLGAVLEWLGAVDVPGTVASRWPTIEIGSSRINDGPFPTIRPWTDGWNFGIGEGGTSSFVFPPACVAAAALAVSEAFSLLRNDNPYAGRRRVAMSLWAPMSGTSEAGPDHTSLIPSSWIVGLGHLGQAYAWMLGFMKQASGATLYLQDVDEITESTLSTSLLSTSNDLGQRKTRAVARWLQGRGYKTAIVERRFDELQKVGPSEPTLALFGVDNAAARRVVESTGFRLVIDGGLGSGYKDFRAIRLRMFPGSSRAADLWSTSHDQIKNVKAPAYEALLAQGVDTCGVTTLATRAVGAPFVGCVAGAFVVSELLRRQMGGLRHDFIDINLRDPEALEAA